MPKADLSPEAYIPVRNRTAVYTDTDTLGPNINCQDKGRAKLAIPKIHVPRRHSF